MANWLTPQFDARGVPVAPGHYRSLVRAAARALAATGHRDDTLLIGEIASVGQTRRSPRTRVMAAELFARRLLARARPGHRLRAAPVHDARPRDRCAPAERPGQLPPARLGRLRALLDRAGRRGVVPRRLADLAHRGRVPDEPAGSRSPASRSPRRPRASTSSSGSPRTRRASAARRSTCCSTTAAGPASRAACGSRPARRSRRSPPTGSRSGCSAADAEPTSGAGSARPSRSARSASRSSAARAAGARSGTLTTDASGTVRARVRCASRGRWRLRWIAPGGRAAHEPRRGCQPLLRSRTLTASGSSRPAALTITLEAHREVPGREPHARLAEPQLEDALRAGAHPEDGPAPEASRGARSSRRGTRPPRGSPRARACTPLRLTVARAGSDSGAFRSRSARHRHVVAPEVLADVLERPSPLSPPSTSRSRPSIAAA